MFFYKNIFSKKINIRNILNIFDKSIDRVGIEKLYYPFIFDNNIGRLQRNIGLWNLSINLNSNKRGIHMSRLISILDKLLFKPFNFIKFCSFYKFFSYKLNNIFFYIQVSFFYFIKKKSPITKIKSFLNYKITILSKTDNIYYNNILKLVIPISSLCPCSKLISNYNAHNQRSNIVIYFKISSNLKIDNIIKIIEDESSSNLWTILKRKDEKYFTEFSYNNPKFVEDLIRNIFLSIFKKNFFILKVENIESIHNHSVYSYIKNKT